MQIGTQYDTVMRSRINFRDL